MGKRINERFLNSYMILDRECGEMLNVPTGGVTEYINRLGGIDSAPFREDVLPLLVKYRNLRNVFAHEPGALKSNHEIESADVAWIKKFARHVSRRKDPLSVCIRRNMRRARLKKLRIGALCTLVVLAILAVVIALLVLGGGAA